MNTIVKRLSCITIAATLLGSNLVLGQAPLPPIKDYVSHPDFKSARISPDGLYIALVAPRDDREALMILDAQTRQVKAAFTTQKNNGISQYWWANEERIVFSTSVNQGGGDQVYATGDLYAINIDDTEKFILAGPSLPSTAGDYSAYDVLNTLENDHDNILVVRWEIRKGSTARSRPETMLMNIYTPPKTNTSASRINTTRTSNQITSPLPWGDIYTDNSGAVRMAYATKEDGKMEVKLRQGEQWIDVTEVLGINKEEEFSSIGRPIQFKGDDTGLYHLARSPQGTIGLALLDLNTGESKLLYAHDKYDITNSDLIMSADDKEILGVTLFGALPEIHYFSENPDVRFYKSLDKSFPGYRVNFQNFTKDQRKAVAMVSGPTMPPGLFILDRDKGEFTPLFSSRPKLQQTPMTPPEPISFTARDGTPIEGYLTKAVGVEGPAPLVVLAHGGPIGIRDNPVFDNEVKLLASRGYSVLQVNFRGSGGYGLHFSELGFHNWGTGMIDDIVDGTQYVVEQKLVDGNKMCIMGGSYGGYASMMSVERYPDLFKCAIGISGVYDLNLMHSGDIPLLPYGENYLDKVIGTDQAELNANSPVKLVSNIKVPIFLAHGGKDRRAPVKHAEHFKDALKKAGITPEWVYVGDAGHGFRDPKNLENLYTKIFEFLGKNLK